MRPVAGKVATLGVIVAAGVTVVTSTSPAIAARPAPQAMPTATTAPPAPRPGTYVGRTGQGLAITLRVARSRRSLTSLTVGFRLRCSHDRAPRFIVSPILAGYPWRLNAGRGLGFTRSFVDTTGERYRLAATFDGGIASGTLRSSWHSSRYGACTTGLVRWRARLGG